MLCFCWVCQHWLIWMVFYVCGLFDLFVRSTHENSTSNEMRKARATRNAKKKKKNRDEIQRTDLLMFFILAVRRKMHRAITSITALISLLTSSYLKELCKAFINIDRWHLCEHVKILLKSDADDDDKKHSNTHTRTHIVDIINCRSLT